MPFEYKHVLIIGATSGIGEALAAKLVQNDVQVIISGRRQDKLDAFVDRYGRDKVKAKAFDIMQLDKVC
jgi:NADP-dependent 3-hydroxy acid dehydrogenase YdfG